MPNQLTYYTLESTQCLRVVLYNYILPHLMHYLTGRDQIRFWNYTYCIKERVVLWHWKHFKSHKICSHNASYNYTLQAIAGTPVWNRVWLHQTIFIGTCFTRDYAQGMTLLNYLIFFVIYHVLSQHEWLKGGALYGNLTRDVVLAFYMYYVRSLTSQLRCLFSTKILLLVSVKLV